ncbi:hypothetical protein ACRC6Q_19045 [Planococcus sp. SE5232]|uniref:hypothetical protein n=1 Tax=unclassified Planococcus (in: firmicutes) TaxID=2662419 RepID=UPI003D6AE99F
MKKDDNPVEKTQLKSIHLKLNEELLSEIDDFTVDYHFLNRTDAMRFLLSSGLKSQYKKEEKGNNN